MQLHSSVEYIDGYDSQFNMLLVKYRCIVDILLILWNLDVRATPRKSTLWVLDSVKSFLFRIWVQINWALTWMVDIFHS